MNVLPEWNLNNKTRSNLRQGFLIYVHKKRGKLTPLKSRNPIQYQAASLFTYPARVRNVGLGCGAERVVNRVQVGRLVGIPRMTLVERRTLRQF